MICRKVRNYFVKIDTINKNIVYTMWYRSIRH